jgi:hypothetical protein
MTFGLTLVSQRGLRVLSKNRTKVMRPSYDLLDYDISIPAMDSIPNIISKHLGCSHYEQLYIDIFIIYIDVRS